MKLASEEAVTKLLSSKEILQIRDKFFISNPISFDLGNFLKKFLLRFVQKADLVASTCL